MYFSCKNTDYPPDMKVNIGNIKAVVNGKRWINDSLQTVQIKFLPTSDQLLRNYPCLKGYGSFSIETFSKPDGYRRINASFTFPLKQGTYDIKSEKGRDLCINLQSGSYLFYSTADGDAGLATYIVDDNEINQVTIESVGNNKLVGSFKISYLNVGGEKSIDYPEKMVISCVHFVAER